jgi:MscS family membrane protein
MSQLKHYFAILLFVSAGALSITEILTRETRSPFEPTQTSSPRETMTGFRDLVSEMYKISLGPEAVIAEYLGSSHLFFTTYQEEQMKKMLDMRGKLAGYLDTSGLAEASLAQTVWRRSFELKEILDRIPLPSPAEIPDEQVMRLGNLKSWMIPGTELTIRRSDSGPQEGRYLFSAETVTRIPAYYRATRDLPYQPGATKGLHDRVFHKPLGLAYTFRHLIPPRWFYAMPSWTNQIVLDQPAWRWIVLLLIFSGIWSAMEALGRASYVRARGGRPFDDVWRLLPLLFIVILAPILTWFLTESVRISGPLFTILNILLTASFFLSLMMMSWEGGRILANHAGWIHDKMRLSADPQLMVLCFRLFGILGALLILTEGADQLGVPAYSVLAGLGVGGLAVALAAQHTLANLFGSLVLTLEKPFKVGQLIRTGDVEGVVEAIGFRTVRIRSLRHTLVNIPCGTVVNRTIENFYHRKKRLTREVILFEPTTVLSEVLDVIPQLNDRLKTYPMIEPAATVVTLGPLTATQYEITIDFCLLVQSDEEEKRARQEIRMDMARVLANGQKRAEKTLPANATWPVRTAPSDLTTLQIQASCSTS